MIIKKLRINHYKKIKRLIIKNGFKIPSYKYWAKLWGNKQKASIGDGIIYRDQIVGYHSYFKKKLIYNNKVYKILVSSNWNVEKKFRNFSLILLNKYFDKNSDIYLTTTASKKVSEIWKTYNAIEINNKGCKKIFFSILNFYKFINILSIKKNSLIMKLFSPVLSILLWIYANIKQVKFNIESLNFKLISTIDKEIDLFNHEYEKKNSSFPKEKRSDGEILRYLNVIKNKKKLFILKIYKKNKIIGYSVLAKEKIYGTRHFRMFLAELRIYKNNYYNLGEIFQFLSKFSKNKNCSILEFRNLNKKIIKIISKENYFLRRINHNPYLIKFSNNFNKRDVNIIKSNFETSYLDGDCLL